MKLWNFSVLGKATDSSLNMQNTRGETVRPMRTEYAKDLLPAFQSRRYRVGTNSEKFYVRDNSALPGTDLEHCVAYVISAARHKQTSACVTRS
jgi:hypothetical protein